MKRKKKKKRTRYEGEKGAEPGEEEGSRLRRDDDFSDAGRFYLWRELYDTQKAKQEYCCKLSGLKMSESSEVAHLNLPQVLSDPDPDAATTRHE